MTEPELPSVHPVSNAGFGEGKAELYEAARPSYPSEVLSYIRKTSNVKNKLNVVEIASGTGKFTRALLSDPEWDRSIAELQCIEPNDGMRTVFAQMVKDPRITLSNGTFDNTEVPDNWADFIVIATAFHWCLQLEAAVKEFIRILKPDGVICFLWNPNDRSKAAWVDQAYAVVLSKHKAITAGEEDFYRWRQIFDLPLYKEKFSEPEETSISYSEPGTLQKVIARFMTGSGIAVLPDDEKESIKEQIKEIVERGDGLVWLDEKNGIFEVPYICPIVIFSHVPASAAGP